ncbi:nicotinate phosphoribosyltransferase [bacterium]|nr:nicotinate phosphoribosyltransferase [bacterium]
MKLNQLPISMRADVYKYTHFKMLPPKTTQIHSYIEPRGGIFNRVIPAGTQYYLEEYFSRIVTKEDIDYTEKRYNTYRGTQGQFDRKMWDRIVEVHGGKLPLEIRAIPEGTPIATSMPLITVINTDPECAALTSFIETLLLKIWYTTTVATKSHNIKKIMKKFLDETSDNPMHLLFMLHDFGDRGGSSEETSALGGMSHLINFRGTDTPQALELAYEYYGEENACMGFVDAMEHSVVTSWGKMGEFDSYDNALEQFKDAGIISIVIDSYNYKEAAAYLASKEKFLKDNNLKCVLRPDSGDPLLVSLDCLQILEKHVKPVSNSKGYKYFENYGVLYGDGIPDGNAIRKILKVITDEGFAADTMVFGMGGGLIQNCTRDDLGFAMKCSAMTADGKHVMVYKQPLGMPSKNSKKGFLDVTTNVKGEFEYVENHMPGEISGSCMETIFKDGEITKRYTLQEIRDRADSGL